MLSVVKFLSATTCYFPKYCSDLGYVMILLSTRGKRISYQLTPVATLISISCMMPNTCNKCKTVKLLSGCVFSFGCWNLLRFNRFTDLSCQGWLSLMLLRSIRVISNRKAPFLSNGFYNIFILDMFQIVLYNLKSITSGDYLCTWNNLTFLVSIFSPGDSVF